MATAKQRAWRAKFARLYGGGRKSRSTRRKARRIKTVRSVVRMSRRGRSRRSSGGGFGRIGGGMMPAAVKNVLSGWGAASALEVIGIGGLVPAVVAGFFTSGTMGALGGAGKIYIKGVQLGSGGASLGGVTVG